MGILPWFMWSVSSLFVVLNYVQQILPTVITAQLAETLNASETTLGFISAAYFFAYAAFQMPVGLVLDRYGIRLPLTIAILVAGFGTLVFSQAHSTLEGLVARLLMGSGFAFSFLGCLKLVHGWFPASRFSTLAGMTNTVAMLGASCGAPIALLVRDLGWRQTLLMTAIATLLLAFVVLAVVKDPRLSKVQKGTDRPASGLPDITGLLRDPQVWMNACYATSISLIFAAFGGLWGGDFIQKRYGLDEIDSAAVNSLLFIGGIAGSLFFGWCSDHFNSRKKPMMGASLAGLLTLGALLYLPHLSLRAFQVCLVMTGFFSSANILSYARARDLSPQAVGYSIGFLSTCFYAGNAASQPVIGYLLEIHSKASGNAAHGVTMADYHFALSFLEISMLVGVILSFRIQENRVLLDDPAAQ